MDQSNQLSFNYSPYIANHSSSRQSFSQDSSYFPPIKQYPDDNSKSNSRLSSQNNKENHCGGSPVSIQKYNPSNEKLRDGLSEYRYEGLQTETQSIPPQEKHDYQYLMSEMTQPSEMFTNNRLLADESSSSSDSKLGGESYAYQEKDVKHREDRTNSRLNSKAKLNINSMVSELEELKDHIQSLESKISFSAKTHLKSPKPKKAQSREQSLTNSHSSTNKQFKRGTLSRDNSRLAYNDTNKKNMTMNQSGYIGGMDTAKPKTITKDGASAIPKKPFLRSSHKSLLRQNSLTKELRPRNRDRSNSALKSNASSSVLNGSSIGMFNHLQSSSCTNKGLESQKKLSTVDLRLDKENQNLNKHQQKQQIDKTEKGLLPQTQKDLLNSKIKEVELYKEKYRKLQKHFRHAKQELAERDQTINNFKSLSREIKTIKQQWRVSEELRAQHQKQVKLLQSQLISQQKENAKLKKKVIKQGGSGAKVKEQTEEPSHAPMKIIIEDKNQKKTKASQ